MKPLLLALSAVSFAVLIWLFIEQPVVMTCGAALAAIVVAAMTNSAAAASRATEEFERHLTREER